MRTTIYQRLKSFPNNPSVSVPVGVSISLPVLLYHEKLGGLNNVELFGFFLFLEDMLHPKRRRTSNSKLLEGKLDHEPHSLSQSQQSSPSQSDHEQTPATKGINGSYPSSRVHPLFRQRVPVPINPKMAIPRTCPDIYSSSDHPNQMKQEHIRNVIYNDACRVQCNAAESLSVEAGKFKNMVRYIILLRLSALKPVYS